MSYQNINQYNFLKFYLLPVREISDISLASDEKDFDEEVVFSPLLIGENDLFGAWHQFGADGVELRQRRGFQPALAHIAEHLVEITVDDLFRRVTLQSDFDAVIVIGAERAAEGAFNGHRQHLIIDALKFGKHFRVACELAQVLHAVAVMTFFVFQRVTT